MPSTPRMTKAQARAARAEAARQAALARQRRQRLLRFGAIAGAALAVTVVVVLVVALRGNNSPVAGAGPTPATQPAGSVPVWPAPVAGEVPAAVRAAGLPLLTMEATDVHFHSHLDIFDNGQQITVPAHVGLTSNAVSSMHTHDDRGVIHIESPTGGTFTLGQFFTEWKQPLSATQVGTLTATATATDPIRFYVNGAAYSGDPTKIQLGPHEEIAVVYGALTVGMTPPSGFAFAASE